MRPDLEWLFFVGPQKTGTTSIYEILNALQRYSLPVGVKETFFFDRHFSKGRDWYLSQFSWLDRLETKKYCEVAPTYFGDDRVIGRLRDFSSDAKVVITLREPRFRAWSHFLHLQRYGLAPTNLHQAVEMNPRIIQDSLYTAQVGKWDECWGADLAVVTLEKCSKDWATALASILDDADIKGGLPVATRHSNRAATALSPRIAYYTTAVADFLRERRLHQIVNFLRDTGLKRLIYSGGRQQVPVPTKSEEALLRDLIPDREVDFWAKYNKEG